MRSVHCFGPASGLVLILMAGLAPGASAQSAKDDRIRPAMLGQQEFVAPLADITPELVQLQQELVDTLSAGLEYAKRGLETGVVQDISTTEQAYYRELEALKIMKARLNNKSISGKEILKIQIAVRSEALASLKRRSELVEQGSRAGTASFGDVTAAKVEALKAEIALKALKLAAGE